MINLLYDLLLYYYLMFDHDIVKNNMVNVDLMIIVLNHYDTMVESDVKYVRRRVFPNMMIFCMMEKKQLNVNMFHHHHFD